MNGTITDNKGNFVVDNIKPGNYKLVAEFLGYKPFILPNLQISKENSLIKRKILYWLRKLPRCKI
jgi:hypothetical protein